MNDYISTPTVGEIIVEEFMKPLNMSVDTLAEGIGLSENRIIELLDGDIQITPELSKRLSAFFGMSELFFYRLQKDIDRRNTVFAERELALA